MGNVRRKRNFCITDDDIKKTSLAAVKLSGEYAQSCVEDVRDKRVFPNIANLNALSKFSIARGEL